MALPTDILASIRDCEGEFHSVAEGIARAYREGSCITVVKDRGNDFATEADEHAEASIRMIIHKYFPDHAILGEEGGAEGESDYEWVIDPIDGTKYFAHAMPLFVLSLGLRYRGMPVYGILIEPTAGRTLAGGPWLSVTLDGILLPPPIAKSLHDTQIYFDTVGRDTLPESDRVLGYHFITRILDRSYRGRTIGASCVVAFGCATGLFGAIIDIFGGMKETDRVAFTAILTGLGMEERWVRIGSRENFWIGHSSILDELESIYRIAT